MSNVLSRHIKKLSVFFVALLALAGSVANAVDQYTIVVNSIPGYTLKTGAGYVNYHDGWGGDNSHESRYFEGKESDGKIIFSVDKFYYDLFHGKHELNTGAWIDIIDAGDPKCHGGIEVKLGGWGDLPKPTVGSELQLIKCKRIPGVDEHNPDAATISCSGPFHPPFSGDEGLLHALLNEDGPTNLQVEILP